MPRPLSKSCRQVLEALYQARGPMSRRMIADKIMEKESLSNGRIAQESMTYNGLIATGDLREIELEDFSETHYTITAKGRKLYESRSDATE